MTASESHPHALHRHNGRRDLAWLLLAFVYVAIVRIVTPSDLATGDQPYQVDYIRDIVHNGAWVAQHLADGTAATKPPLYNWLAAAGVIATGSESDFMLKLPSLIAGLLTLLLTWDLVRRSIGHDAAFFTGLFLIASTMYSKQMYFARTDMLLTFFVVLQVWLATRHDRMTRRDVVLFWTAASLAMLTKGPIGVVIPLLGLGFWWWRRNELGARLRELHVILGSVIALAVFAIWFVAASAVEPGVFDQLVYAETIDRFKASSSKSKENRHLFYYVPHFLGRMAPASIFAVIGGFTLLRTREDRDRAGVALWWFLATFVLLSLVPSKRADRMFPLFPAVCVVAGWAVAGRVRGSSTAVRVFGWLFALLGVAAIVAPFAGVEAVRAISPLLLLPLGFVITVAGVCVVLMMRRDQLRPAMTSMSVAMLAAITIYQVAFRN